MRSRTPKALLWSAVEQIGGQGGSALLVLVLVRYIPAVEFGLFASMAIVINITARLAALGLTTTLLARSSLSEEALASAFWAALGCSLLVGCVVALAAPVVAALFDAQRIADLLPILALALPLLTMGGLLQVPLRRALRMRTLAWINLAGILAAAGVSIPMARAGQGAEALVAQLLALAGTRWLLLLVCCRDRWWQRPKPKQALRLVREGRPVLATELLRMYTNEAPRLFVGLLIGLEALGLFSIAGRVVNLLNYLLTSTFSQVALPLLAQAQHDLKHLRARWRSLLKAAALIGLPTYAGLAVLREPVVLLALGTQWRGAEQLLPPLAIAGLLMMLASVHHAATVAIGRADTQARYTLLSAAVVTGAVLASSAWGVFAVAVAMLIRPLLIEPLQVQWLAARLGMRAGALLPLLGTAIAATAVMAAVLALLGAADAQTWSALAVHIVTGALSYTLTLLALDAELRQWLREALSQAREGRSSRGGGTL